jgi:hypothetical protein
VPELGDEGWKAGADEGEAGFGVAGECRQDEMFNGLDLDFPI